MDSGEAGNRYVRWCVRHPLLDLTLTGTLGGALMVVGAFVLRSWFIVVMAAVCLALAAVSGLLRLRRSP
jgi:hypothetical protein